MSAHAGADAGTGEFATHRVGGASLEALGKNGNRECGRISNQQMHVVGLAVELRQIDIQLGADGAHGGFGEGEHGIGEQFAPKLGYEHQVRMQQRHAVPSAAIGRGCQRHTAIGQRFWGVRGGGVGF